MAEDLGKIVREETGGIGADVLILAIGVPALVQEALNMLKKGGTLCLFAGFTGEGMCTLSANLIHYNEIHVCGSTAYRRSDYLAAADIVCSGKINLDQIATHEFSLEKFRQAYETCKAGVGLKIIIKP